jgi:hypothetical protein
MLEKTTLAELSTGMNTSGGHDSKRRRSVIVRKQQGDAIEK